MSTAGIQIFDENGNVMLDMTNRLTKYLGTCEVNGNDGYLVDSRLKASVGSLWIAYLNYTVYQGRGVVPDFEKQDGKLVYTYNTAGIERAVKVPVKIIYGIY